MTQEAFDGGRVGKLRRAAEAPVFPVRLGADHVPEAVERFPGEFAGGRRSRGLELPEGLAAVVVTDQPIVAAVALDDPWHTRRTVRLPELAGRAVIALPVGTGIRHQFDGACADAGVDVHVAFEASTPQALADLAARGLGVAVLPQAMVRSRADLHLIRLTPALRGRLVFAWRAGGPMSPAARELVNMARRLLAVGGPE